MASIVQTNISDTNIRVALIIEQGTLRPVWFEEVDKQSHDRVFIKEVCYKWTHMKGNAKILNFSVYDGVNNYRLSLNTKDFTWEYGITEKHEFSRW